jgi:hypothetical protein
MSRVMKRTFPTRLGAAIAVLPLLLLAACGSNHEDAPITVSVTELAAGSYAVSAGDSNSPTAGKYYAAADGSRLLVLNNSAQQAANVYRRDAKSTWTATPAVSTGTTLELLNSSSISSTTMTLAAVAGSYTVRLASGSAAAFTVSASGDIVAGSTTCKLSGKLALTTLPNALKLTLATSGCGDLAAQSDGYLVVDSDYSPAAFRLLTTGGAAPLDLWAYAE